jgi:glutamate 5-kinase
VRSCLVGGGQLYSPDRQALAAIGQCRLISLWDSLFGHLRQPIAQILLTRNDIADVSLGSLIIKE